MKTLSLVLFTMVLYLTGSGQNLSGRWIGCMIFGKLTVANFNYLSFSLNSDGSYSVYSSPWGNYINVRDTVMIYNISLQQKKNEAFVLDKGKQTSSDILKKYCSATYLLKVKIVNGETILEGKYIQNNYSCSWDVRFIKVNEETKPPIKHCQNLSGLMGYQHLISATGLYRYLWE